MAKKSLKAHLRQHTDLHHALRARGLEDAYQSNLVEWPAFAAAFEELAAPNLQRDEAGAGAGSAGGDAGKVSGPALVDELVRRANRGMLFQGEFDFGPEDVPRQSSGALRAALCADMPTVSLPGAPEAMPMAEVLDSPTLTALLVDYLRDRATTTRVIADRANLLLVVAIEYAGRQVRRAAAE